MASNLFRTGYYGTASIAGGNITIGQWKVTPSAKLEEFMNSGTSTDVIREPSWRDVKVTLSAIDYDFNNDIYSIADATITNPPTATPNLFPGCIVTSVKLYLNTTAKGVPSGGLLWSFASLIVQDMPQTLDVKGKITNEVNLMGAGTNGSSSVINSWGFQTVTPP